MKLSSREAIVGYLFVLPTIVITVAISMYPITQALYISFFRKIFGTPAIYIGIKNYIELFHSELFWRSLYNTVVYAFTAVAMKMSIGIGVALILNQKHRFQGILRTITLVPWVLPTFVAALIWYWLYHPTLGPLNAILEIVGFKPVLWLSRENAMRSVVFVNFWQGMPFYAVSMLAAMQSISIELYEAASIDGAGPIRSFIHITIPSIKSVLLTLILLSTIWTWGDFVTIWTLTQGGPGNATKILPLYIYDQAFYRLDLGFASAVSIISIPIFVSMMLITMKLIRR